MYAKSSSVYCCMGRVGAERHGEDTAAVMEGASEGDFRVDATGAQHYDVCGS